MGLCWSCQLIPLVEHESVNADSMFVEQEFLGTEIGQIHIVNATLEMSLKTQRSQVVHVSLAENAHYEKNAEHLTFLSKLLSQGNIS